MTQVLTFAHSPDSDDIFMAYGLACGAVTVPGVTFAFVREEIEILNQRAREGRYPMTAISFAAYPHIKDRYRLMTVGASMGEGDYGPVVVARRKIDTEKPLTVAVPGRHTTAALLLQLALPRAQMVFLPFREVLPAVVSGNIDAGLLIHESQLQFAGRGCRIVVDMPAWWRERTGLPIPLGTNAIRRDLSETLQSQLVAGLRASIQYALDHREAALRYTQIEQGDSLPISGLDRYVGMYVNQRTLEIGSTERQAVQTLFDAALDAGLFTERLTAEWV